MWPPRILVNKVSDVSGPITNLFEAPTAQKVLQELDKDLSSAGQTSGNVHIKQGVPAMLQEGIEIQVNQYIPYHHIMITDRIDLLFAWLCLSALQHQLSQIIFELPICVADLTRRFPTGKYGVKGLHQQALHVLQTTI